MAKKKDGRASNGGARKGSGRKIGTGRKFEGRTTRSSDYPQIAFRCTEAERDVIRIKANSAKLTVSEWIKKMLLD